VSEPEDPASTDPAGELHTTARWRGVTAVAFAAGGAGVITRQPAVLLVAVVAVAFAAHARAGSAPPIAVAVERELGTDSARPGERVEVRLRVVNEGDRLLPDVRLVDGVPEALSVPGGDAARHGTALRPGASEAFVYTVEASRGVHAFDPVTVAARDPSGSEERRAAVRAAGDTELVCIPTLGNPVALPLRRQTMDATGEVRTREGGSGVSFHSVREYRRGDPFNRIDWKRTARTGDLTTIEFQREQAAAAVVVIDAREGAYLGAEPEAEPAVERAVGAAGAVVAGLLDGGNRVGIAALAPTSAWVPPGAGESHRARLRETLATHRGLAPAPPEDFHAYTAMLELRRRLPAGAQIVLFTPLSDDYSGRLARRLGVYGHRVTVVAPDATVDDTAGRRLARVQRALRVGRLRQAGVRVIDWGSEEPFPSAVERARRRWSA
jgi:uncharacterized protein (DUF58 family)